MRLGTYYDRQDESRVDIRTACRGLDGFLKGVDVSGRVFYRGQSRRGAGILDRGEVHGPPVGGLLARERGDNSNERIPTCHRRTPSSLCRANRPGVLLFLDRGRILSAHVRILTKADEDRDQNPEVGGILERLSLSRRSGGWDVCR